MDFYKKIIRSKSLRFKILNALKFVPDKLMLQIQYYIKTGHPLNLNDPERYTEKLQWYKLYYRNTCMQRCADKYLVREYIEAKGLGYILPKTYAVFQTVDEISFDSLPERFTLKVSNGSGTNLLCREKAAYDLAEVKKQFGQFLIQSGSRAGREWVYEGGQPVIVAGEYLEDPDSPGGDLRDYKILCFNGKAEYIICVDGRYTDHYCHVVYDTKWNKQDVVIGESSAAANYERPETLDEMLHIAERLAEGFPAARIDLYSIQQKVYFGEITFFPWSGYMKFTPDQFDYELGKKFVLPERNA